jgi:CheY-like chemotaxis protein
VLSVTREQDQLHFNIQDTGIGIASERLERIFEPFTQADASVTQRYGGTGLGTTICKQLVELMGGKIWLDSLFGVGTHFHVLLPIVIGEAPAALTPQTAVTLPVLNILVADDVQQNLDLLALILRERGHKITLAHDGHEAVDLARERQFDLILMDVQMPGMDGLTATRQIRQYEQEKHQPPIPVIALTASVFQDDRFAARDAGMDGFASKPQRSPHFFGLK